MRGGKKSYAGENKKKVLWDENDNRWKMEGEDGKSRLQS
jgi:hypothetical protein